METLERLQQQLETGDDLSTVVHAMKALAAASIQQYERAVHTLAAYTHTVALGLHVLLRDGPRPAAATPSGPRGLIVLGSERGLCGRFNEDVADLVQPVLAGATATRLVAVGARIATTLELSGHAVEAVLELPFSAARITDTVQRLLVQLDVWREEGVGDVRIAFNASRGRARSRATIRSVFPLDVAELAGLGGEPWPSRSIPTYSLPRDELLAALIRQHIFILLVRACAESLASEHSARLMAMQTAEKNLQERQAELTRRYRRRRQERITAELLDVIAGFEALTAEQ